MLPPGCPKLGGCPKAGGGLEGGMMFPRFPIPPAPIC